jgi:hypothetical protein
LKNAIFGQSYRFGEQYILIASSASPGKLHAETFLHLHFASWASLTALRFLFLRFNCMVGVV